MLYKLKFFDASTCFKMVLSFLLNVIDKDQPSQIYLSRRQLPLLNRLQELQNRNSM